MLVIAGKEVFTTLEELVNPKHTALLLIDLQNDFIMPGGFYDNVGWDTSASRQIVPHVKRVLETARHSGVLVVHVQVTLYPNFMVDSPASLRRRLVRKEAGDSVDKLIPYTIEGSWGGQIIDELAPLSNEVVVKKHRASAFMGTDLDMLLRSNDIKSVCIVGLVTQGCVMATVNDAPVFGYYPVLLRDCVASRKQTLRDAALFLMSENKDVVDSAEVLEIWTQQHSVSR